MYATEEHFPVVIFQDKAQQHHIFAGVILVQPCNLLFDTYRLIPRSWCKFRAHELLEETLCEE